MNILARGCRTAVVLIAITASSARLCAQVQPDSARQMAPEGPAAVHLYVESGIRHSARSLAFSSDGTLVAAGSLDRTIKVWDARSGRELTTLPHDSMATAMVFVPGTTRLAANAEDGSVSIWDVASGGLVFRVDCGTRPSPSIAVDQSGGRLLCFDSRALMVRSWNLVSQGEEGSTATPGLESSAKLTPDGSFILASEDGVRIRMIDWRSGATIGGLPNGRDLQFDAVAIAPKTRRLAVLASDGGNSFSVWSWSGSGVASDEQVVAAELPHAIAFTSDERQVGYAAENGDIVVVDVTNRSVARRFTSHGNRVENAGLADGQRSALVVHTWYDKSMAIDLRTGAAIKEAAPVLTYDNVAEFKLQGELFGRRFVVDHKQNDRVRLLSDGGQELATLIVLDKIGSWVAIDPSGRFDTNMDLSNIKGVHWNVPGRGIDIVPLEMLMRDYYEPRLVPRVLAGSTFAPLPAIATLVQARPRVEIVSVKAERRSSSGPSRARTVQVIVDVFGDRDAKEAKTGRRALTGVYDLRLFRDGQLVGQKPRSPDRPVDLSQARREELEQWRKDRVVLREKDAPENSKRIIFKGVRVPNLPNNEQIEFSAYAFNVDRIKSDTDRMLYAVPTTSAPPERRAYIITFGVNSFEDHSWDLRYAANDARESGTELRKRLQALVDPNGARHYREVVWVPLISDRMGQPGQANRAAVSQANKKQLEAVLKRLSGQPSDTAALAGVQDARKLRRVNPEDLFIFVVSTHGLVDAQGRFFLLPADIGKAFAPAQATELKKRAALFARAISNDDLARWMQGLDAIDQVMIIDACRSAASVQDADFKPGPMGSRGLGQLAYDQGMRVLAASQVEQDAADGSDQTRMGLLIYALIEDGLRAGKADRAPKDGKIMLSEWLNYGSLRVPELFEEIRVGTLRGSKGTVERSSKSDSVQRPSLFDFSRSPDLPLVDGVR